MCSACRSSSSFWRVSLCVGLLRAFGAAMFMLCASWLVVCLCVFPFEFSNQGVVFGRGLSDVGLYAVTYHILCSYISVVRKFCVFCSGHLSLARVALHLSMAIRVLCLEEVCRRFICCCYMQYKLVTFGLPFLSVPHHA